MQRDAVTRRRKGLHEILHATGKRQRGLLGTARHLAVAFVDGGSKVLDPLGQRSVELVDLGGNTLFAAGERRRERLNATIERAGRLVDPLGDPGIGVVERVLSRIGELCGDFEHLLPQCAGNHGGAALKRRADVLDTCLERLGHGFRAFFQDTLLLLEGAGNLANIGGDRVREPRALFAEPFHVRLQDFRERVARLGEFVGLDRDQVLDLVAGAVELLDIRFQCARQSRAAFLERLDVAGDGTVNAGALVVELAEVRLQRDADLAAAFLQLAREIGSAAVEHDRCRRHEVGQLAGDRFLAGLDDRGDVALAENEGVGDLARPLHKALIDRAHTMFECRIEAFRAGVQRFSAGLELGDQHVAALGEDLLDALDARIERAGKRVGRIPQNGDHAGRSAVEEVAKLLRDVVGAIGQRRDASVEHARERLAGGGDALRDDVHALVDGLVKAAAGLVHAVDERVAGAGDGPRQRRGCREHAVADAVAGRAELFLEMLVRAGDRRADAVRV